MWKSSLLVVPVLFAFMAGCADDAQNPESSSSLGNDSTSDAKKPAATPSTSATIAADAPTTAPDATDDTPIEPMNMPPAPAGVVAWYKDGTTTGTGSANDLGALKVDASTVTIAQLTTLMESSKYNGLPRAKDKPADFDEVFLSRATNAAFMGKLGKAVKNVVADGYPQVIVYSNGPRCIAEAAPNGWANIAKAGAMIGLEAYTTTLTADITAAEKAHPFKDVADLAASIDANPELFAAFETRLTTYVTDTKKALGNDSLSDHITLLQYENMSHDIDRLVASGYTTDKATHFAALWYAAHKTVAAKQSIHWGIWHPA